MSERGVPQDDEVIDNINLLRSGVMSCRVIGIYAWKDPIFEGGFGFGYD